MNADSTDNPPALVSGSADADALEPGWLMRTCQEATISMMASHGRSFWQHVGRDREPDAQEIDALYAKMDERFRSWSGKSFAEYAAIRQLPDQESRA